MKTRKEIKAIAKEAMMAQRKTSVFLILSLLGIVLASNILGNIPSIGGLISFALGFVLIVWGINLFGEFIKVWQREPASVEQAAQNIKVNFWRKVGGTYWMALWVILWSLLFIIPGIIKSLSYYFTQNILADCPEVKATDAIKISMKITAGHKMDIFIFILSWLGWHILSVFTFGILYVVYVGPYWYTADAGFYIEMRNEAIAEGRITPEELGKTGAELGI